MEVNRGSALLWVLILAALALTLGSGVSHLLWQQEAIRASNYALLRANANAENGIEWARVRWLEALLSQEGSLPVTARWNPADDTDYAHLSFTRLSDDRWRVDSTGFFSPGSYEVFSFGRRHIEVLLPTLKQTISSSLAISGSISGWGSSLFAVESPAQNHLIGEEVKPGVSLLAYSGSGSYPEIMKYPFRLRSPESLDLSGLPVYLGPFIMFHDSEDDTAPLQLNTYETREHSLWSHSGELYDVMVCSGYICIGSEAERSITLGDKRIVVVADTIEVNGNFLCDDSAQIWLIAEHEIIWHTNTSACGLFRGLLWSTGGVRIDSSSGASWEVAGAIYARDLQLTNVNIYFSQNVSSYLPETVLPLPLSLPVPLNWRLLAP
ncbi:MAG: hypothetical protein FWE76_02100 [Symbiobacteriaceae bacterium]|nr:hypothetical protein [Symbiobacteriaceae bacterium]